MPNLMQLVERNTCALSKQLLGEDLSQFITHNEHQEETVAVDPHILNWIKSSCLIRSVKFVKIITWKFISWSQGKFLVFAAGQSRTSRGNTCHIWSCFFGACKYWRRTCHTHKGNVDAFPLVFPFFLGSICKSTAGGSRNPRAAWFCTLFTFTGNTPRIIRVRFALHDCFIMWFICSFVCFI